MTFVLPVVTPLNLDEYQAALATARLDLAADSLAKASTPEPFSTSKTSNWVAKGGGLPDYIQHVAHGILESSKGEKTESQAIAMAIGIVKKWAAGGKDVDKGTQAAAAKAVAEWEALKAKNKATNASAPVGLLPGETPLDVAGYLLALSAARERALDKTTPVLYTSGMTNLAVFDENKHPRLHGKFAKKGLTADLLKPDAQTAKNVKAYKTAIVGARDYSDARQKGGMVGPDRHALDAGFAHSELRGSAGFGGKGMGFDHPIHGKYEVTRGSGDKYAVKHPDGETSTHADLPDAVAHLRALGKSKPGAEAPAGHRVPATAQATAYGDGQKIGRTGLAVGDPLHDSVYGDGKVVGAWQYQANGPDKNAWVALIDYGDRHVAQLANEVKRKRK